MIKTVLFSLFGVLVIFLIVNSKNSERLLPQYVEQNITIYEEEPLVSDNIEDNASILKSEPLIEKPEEDVIIIKEPALTLVDTKTAIKKLRKKIRKEKDIEKKKLLRVELAKLKKQKRDLRRSQQKEGFRNR